MLQSVIDNQAITDLKILTSISFCIFLSPYIAKFLRLPISATEIILGALIAYFGFIDESLNFKVLANIGFFYLMFIAGMEVNLRTLFGIEKALFQKSLLYIFSLYIISALFVWGFELNYILILIIPVMSVGLITMLFKDFDKDCDWLKISMLVATMAEVVSIILITITGAFLQEDANILEVVKNILYLVSFLAICLFGFKFLGIVFWWYPHLKTILMPQEDKNEKDIRFCMAIFILVIVAMIIAKLEIALGAFIAGSFIATFFDHKHDLERKLSSFGYGFLIPVFFIYIGTTFDIKMIFNYDVLVYALFIMFVMIFVRFLSSCVFLKDIGFKNTLLFGLSHSMPLTLLIAIATLSYSANVISSNLYSSLILTSVFEAIVVMILIKFISNFKRRENEKS